jgi:hypothetical protein
MRRKDTSALDERCERVEQRAREVREVVQEKRDSIRKGVRRVGKRFVL